MEKDMIEAYVLCREHIDYFQNAKMELMQGRMTLKTNNPPEISSTLKYYSGIEEINDEINYEDCIDYIKIFEESKVKINKSMVKHWLEDNDKTINELAAVLEKYEEHVRFLYESYGYLESHNKQLASDLDEDYSEYEMYLLKRYDVVQRLLYDLEFTDHHYMENNENVVDKFDIMKEEKVLLGETNPFKKYIKILECSDVSFIQTALTLIVRRTHLWGALSYNWGDALTFIKAIERLRELVDCYVGELYV